MIEIPHLKPTPSTELKVMETLLPRITLSEKDLLHYGNLKKDFNGEQNFIHLLEEKFSIRFILCNNLLFKVNNTEFQIDILLISSNRIYMFEVKNYEGDFIIQDEQWFVFDSNKEIRNPLLQLKRSDFLLRQLLQQLGYDFPVESYLVFMNKEFALYQLPSHLPILLHSQLNRFIKKINTSPSALTNRHIKLSEQLNKKHIVKTFYEQIPD